MRGQLPDTSPSSGAFRATFSPREKAFPVIQKRSRCFAQRLLFYLVFGSGYSFGNRCAFSSAGRSARYKSTAHTVDSSELTSVTPLAILVTTEAISAG